MTHAKTNLYLLTCVPSAIRASLRFDLIDASSLQRGDHQAIEDLEETAETAPAESTVMVGGVSWPRAIKGKGQNEVARPAFLMCFEETLLPCPLSVIFWRLQ